MSTKDNFQQLPPRQWVRPDEVAAYLGVSTRHVRRLCERGLFTTFRTGSVLRIGRESVLRYIREAVADYQFQNGFGFDDSPDLVGTAGH